MKKISILVFLLCASFVLFIRAQEIVNAEPPVEEEYIYDLRSMQNSAFKAGEILEYKLAYGPISAGTAKLEVKNTALKMNGRQMYHIVGIGKSNSAFDWIFKVRDRYETYLDVEGVFPWLFIRRINEGGYKKSQDYQFYQGKGTVKTQDGKSFDVPHGIQDMISSFYYARTIDFSNAEVGQVFQFDSFVDDEIYPLRIKYAGKETIKIGKGKFRCMVFHPAVQEGRIFSSDEDLTVYITDDGNKIPILARAKILVGSIRMELTDYQNLANPVSKLK